MATHGSEEDRIVIKKTRNSNQGTTQRQWSGGRLLSQVLVSLSLDRTSSSIYLSDIHTICIRTHTLLPLFTVAQLLYQFLWMSLEALTHVSLLEVQRAFLSATTTTNDEVFQIGHSLSVGLDEWMACDRARRESYGNFTLYIKLFLIGLLLLLVAFPFPRGLFVLYYSYSILNGNTIDSTRHQIHNLLSFLFVVNFLYFIIPGRGNRALYCNPYVYVQDEKSFALYCAKRRAKIH